MLKTKLRYITKDKDQFCNLPFSILNIKFILWYRFLEISNNYYAITISYIYIYIYYRLVKKTHSIVRNYF